MYGTETISEAQEKDIEKAFYAGMGVAYVMIISLDNNEETALSQLDKLSSEIMTKIKGLANEL